jgi:hypothetical protein
MNDWKRILTTALAIIVVLMLSNQCSNESTPTDSSPESLVGTWKMNKIIITQSPGVFLTLTAQQAGLSIEILFRENNTYKRTTSDSTEAEIDSGSWSTSGSQLLITEDGADTAEVFQYELEGTNLRLLSNNSPLSEFENLPTTLEFTLTRTSIVSSSGKRS